MLAVGSPVPDARAWTAIGVEPTSLRDALGDGLVLLCFYMWDWSPT